MGLGGGGYHIYIYTPTVSFVPPKKKVETYLLYLLFFVTEQKTYVSQIYIYIYLYGTYMKSCTLPY